jgi:two-component system OmpR family response regulator
MTKPTEKFAALRTALYIDDEADIRQIVQMALSLTAGLIVHVGASGEEALALSHRLQPDLLLLDVMMPGLDGPGTLRRMREDAAIAHIPVIFVTAKAMPREVAMFRDMGAIGVIGKPFDPLQLGKQIQTLWSEHGAGAAGRDQEQRDFDLKMKHLAASFLQRTSTAAASLPVLLERIERGDLSGIEELENVAHRMNGGGATFGFHNISGRAEELERLIVHIRVGLAPSGLTPTLLRRLRDCVQLLTNEIAAPS